MTFKPRSAYYLRISTNVVLPLFLYLDERHIDWMSDVVLQHVLSDLRPLLIPKLEAERDIHFGAGAAPGVKRGTVEVHRGETYQFAYFFRKTEPHSVLLKSRYFVTAPLRPETVRPTGQRPGKRSGTQTFVQQSKRKRAKTKGKGEFSQAHYDEDEWTAEESDDTEATGPILRRPRPIRKWHHSTADVHQEDECDNVEELQDSDIAMGSPPPETSGTSSGNPSTPAIDDTDTIDWDVNGQSNFSTDIALGIEQEEKPKPLLKLKYQPFSISGHCLCVVVEPWPPQPSEARLLSAGLGTSFSPYGSLGSSPHLSNEPVVTRQQRAKTPLFFPENDRAPSEAPLVPLPSAPSFYDATKSDEHNDDLMNFSQTLNAAGHMHTITADDEDDMDGAVLFGDADEIKELL